MRVKNLGAYYTHTRTVPYRRSELLPSHLNAASKTYRGAESEFAAHTYISFLLQGKVEKKTPVARTKTDGYEKDIYCIHRSSEGLDPWRRCGATSIEDDP